MKLLAKIKLMLQTVYKGFFRFLIVSNLYYLVAIFLLFQIEERKNGVWKARNLFAKSKKDVIFISHPELFRSDLEYLADNAKYSVYKLSVKWQRRIVDIFYSDNLDRRTVQLYNSDQDPELHKCKMAAENFLVKMLKIFYGYIKPCALMVANVRHIDDYEWNVVSQRLGIPCILFFREGNMVNGNGYSVAFNRHQRFGNFYGKSILVHNEITKKMFVESGFASESEVAITGLLRTDELVNKVQSAENNIIKNSILFFMPSPPVRRSKSNPYAVYYRNVIRVLLEIAVENSDYTIRVKFKPERCYLKNEIQDFKEVLSDYGFDLNKIPNLIVCSDEDVYDLILTSEIISGTTTTALMEAFLAQKYVVIPLLNGFYDGLKTESEFVYAEHLDLFLVANTIQEYKNMLLPDKSSLKITSELHEKRTSFCNKYFSRENGPVLPRVVAEIDKVKVPYHKHHKHCDVLIEG